MVDPPNIAWDIEFWAGNPGFTVPVDGATIPSGPTNLGTQGGSFTFIGTPVWRTDIDGSGKPAIETVTNSEQVGIGRTSSSQTSISYAVVGRGLGLSDFDILDSAGDRILLDMSSGEWRIYNGVNHPSGVATDTDLHLFIVEFTANDVILDIDSSNIMTSTNFSSPHDPSSVYFGGSSSGSGHASGSQIAYVGFKNGALTTQEKSDLWAWYQEEYLGIGGATTQNIKMGDDIVTAIFIGDDPVIRVYQGDTLTLGEAP